MPRERKRRVKKRRKQKGRTRMSSAVRGAYDALKRQLKKENDALKRRREYIYKNPIRGTLGLGALAGAGALAAEEAHSLYRGDGSPTAAAFRRANDYFKNTPRQEIIDDIKSLPQSAKEKVISAATEVKESVMGFPGRFRSLLSRKKEETGVKSLYGKRRRRRRSFGKKAKKPSAATRRMCRKLKVKMTLKRGGKRVYKSEAMLKKQCKKAMKRKSKK